MFPPQRNILKPGDLVLVHYRNNFYGIVKTIEHRFHENGPRKNDLVCVQRVADNYAQDSSKPYVDKYDESFLTKIDEDFITKKEEELQRIVDLFQEYNKDG